MDKSLQTYWENTQKPWGKLFYRVVWDQLPSVKSENVLDFGSGFGITASHFSEWNKVIAVEPNAEMAESRVGKGKYQQLAGNVKLLKSFESESFGLILCHNVLEYAPEREDILREFSRLLKPGGFLSIVKHNHPGRVMQKVVFENALDEAISLLEGGDLAVLNFGKVRYYSVDELLRQLPEMALEKVFGVRTFWALQHDNSIKEKPEWQEKMFRLERMVYEQDPYRQIAFFHHLLLRKGLCFTD